MVVFEFLFCLVDHPAHVFPIHVFFAENSIWCLSSMLVGSKNGKNGRVEGSSQVAAGFGMNMFFFEPGLRGI